MRLALFAVVATLVGACSAHAQIPLLTGPYDPGTTQGTFNKLIQQINGLSSVIAGAGMPNSVLATTPAGLTSALAPLTGIVVGSAGAANNIVITGGASGIEPSIAGFGTDADVSLHLMTQGRGVVSLLYGSQGGYLKFANQGSWYPANGLASCPAFNGVPMGAHSTIQGYIAVKDWTGTVRYLPAC